MKDLVIILMFPERGALNASFMLAKRLSEQGYDILYLTNNLLKEHVTEQGFNTCNFDLDPFYNKIRRAHEKVRKKKRWLERQLNLITMVYKRNDWLENYLERELSWLWKLQPALVLLDPILMNCSIPFIKRNVPICHLNTTFAYRVNSRSYPVFSNVIPANANSPLTRLAIVYTWCILWFKIIKKDWLWHLRYGFVPTRTINTAKEKLKNYGANYFWGEYGYRLKCPELVLAPRDLDFKVIADDDKRCYIGASVYRGRKEGEFDFNPAGGPLIYCSLGTYGHLYPQENNVLLAVIDLMRSIPNWQAVIQTQSSKTLDLKLPKNVVLISHVPQLKVLQHATLAITHAGCSSFKECAFTGTPMIAVPWNNDGYGNSARVVQHELGVCLKASTVSASLLREAVFHVTSNERIQFCVREMQKKILGQEGCEKGVEYITNLMTKNDK